MGSSRASIYYPKSLGEFQAWFLTDADCLDNLEWLRWPSGFICPACGHPGGWRLQDGRFVRTLQLAANHERVRYHDLVMAGHPKAVPPNLPRKRGDPPAWSDLCRTALGGKSLTPVKWIPPPVSG